MRFRLKVKPKKNQQQKKIIEDVPIEYIHGYGAEIGQKLSESKKVFCDLQGSLMHSIECQYELTLKTCTVEGITVDWVGYVQKRP